MGPLFNRKDVLDSKIDEQFPDEDTKQGIEEDSNERVGAKMDKDDYVRIDDALQDLVDKDARELKVVV